MIRVPRTHWASAAAISVLAFGVVFGTYFLVYVNRQEEYYKGRNFRVLQTVGTQLTEQIEAFRQLLVSYSPSREEIEAAYQESAGRPWHKRRLEILEDEIRCALEDLDEASDALAAAKGLEVVPEQQRVAHAEWKWGRLREQEAFLSRREAGILSPAKLVLRDRLESLRRVPGFSDLTITIDGPGKPDGPTCEDDNVVAVLERGRLRATAGACKEPGRCWRERPDMTAEVPIQGLVDFTPALQIFDEVLIADEQGVVLDRKGAMQSGIHDLSSFVADPAGAAESALQPRPPPGTSNGKPAPGMRPGVGRLPDAATFLEAEPIGGVDYSVFILPIPAPFREAGESGRSWYVTGLVGESAFRAQNAAVPMPVLNLTVLALSVCALLWPFMKLGFSSPDEEIRSAAVASIGLSLIAGVGVLVFASMVIFTGVSRREQRDRTLQTISWDIRKSFRSELKHLLLRLDEEAIEISSTRWPSQSIAIETDPEPASRIAQPQAWPPDPSCSDIQTLHEREKQTARSDQERRILASGLYRQARSREKLPPFEIAFGLDKDGMQRSDIRSYRKDHVSGCFAAKDREYFRRIRDGEAWKIGGRGSGFPAHTFFMERVRARGRGSVSYVLSAPHPDAGDPGAIVKVVALIGNLRSLTDVVLPPGYGFVVVENASGKTIHHSHNDVWSLVEFFFEETDDDQSLRAAIRLHSNEWVSANYYGRPHRFYTAPLRDTEWSVVVFHREALAQAAQFELLVVSASLLFVHVLFVGVALWIGRWLAPAPRGWSWLWPSPERGAAYPWLIPGLAAVLWTGSTALSGMHGHFVPLALLGQIAAVVACVAFALSAPSPASRDRSLYRWAWLIGTVLLACYLRKLAGNAWSVEGITWMLSLLVLLALAIRGSLAHGPLPESAAGGHWRTAYLLVAVLLVAVVAGLPSVAIFRDALRFESDRFAIFKAQRLADGLLAREGARRTEMSRINPVRAALYQPQPRELPDAKLCCRPLPGRASCEGDDLWSLTDDFGRCKQTVPVSAWRQDENPPPPPTFSGWLAKQIPAMDGDFGSSRFAEQGRAADGRWDVGYMLNGRKGVRVGADAERAVPVNQATYCPAPVGNGGAASFAQLISSAVVPSPCNAGDMSDRTGRIAILFACLLVSPLVYATSRRLFAFGQPATPRVRSNFAAIRWLEESRLILGATAWEYPAIAAEVERNACKSVEAESILRLDLRLPEEPAASIRTLHAKLRLGELPELVIVGPLDYALIEPLRRRTLLELLEELRRRKLCVCAVSEISLLAALSLPGPASTASSSARPLPAGPAAEPKMPLDEVTRWIAVLEWLRVTEWNAPGSPADWKAYVDPVEAVLERECGWRAELDVRREEFQARFAGLTRYECPSEKQLIESIGIAAEPTYRRVWETCPKEERLALLHLANGSFVNTRNTEVLRSLERRRVIARDPVLRITSCAFARYARRAEDAERLKQWERSAHESSWVALRIPIVFLVVGLALFVTYSGPEFTSSSLTAIPALVGAIPTLLGVLNSIRGSSRSTPAGG